MPQHRLNQARSGGILLVVVILVALSAVGIGAWVYQRQTSSYAGNDNAPIVDVVTKGPFDHVVLEQGEVESSSNNEVKCEVEARGGTGTPILWVIDEGAYVKKGDKLCELDSSALENELKAQRIVLSAAEAKVISSDAAVRQAVIARQEYLDGTYQTDRQLILSEIDIAEQNKRKAQLSLASAERLAAKGTLRPLQIQAEQFAVQNATNILEAAQKRLKVLDELTKEKMLVQLDSTIETARAQLESDRSVLLEEKQKLEDLQTQIENCTMYAPADGQVVHANQRDRRGSTEFVVEPGAMIREQQTLFLLPDPTKMQVRAKVNESRITLIAEGMPVKIKIGPENLIGRVSKVNKYAEAGGWMTSSVKEYATLIEIMDPPPTIRTGMTAEVRIFVEQLQDAVQLPVHGVYETKGHHLVLKQTSPNSYETVEVEIGGTNDQYVTIKDGLQEGDKIVLNPRQHHDLMDIPEFEDATERDKLREMGKNIPAPDPNASRLGGGASGGEGPGAGGPGAGGPGAGGGRPSAAQIVTGTMQRMDTDSDGKISAAEAASDERMGPRFKDQDTNGDGFLDRAELTTGVQKMMQQWSDGPPR